MLFTRCILDVHLPLGALRISVMSRHTGSEGKIPDLRLPGRFDEHRSIIGPSLKLIGRYYRHEIDWNAFRVSYLLELTQGEKSMAVDELIALALDRDIVILCIEEDPTYCHRRLLAEECKRRCPALEIDIG